MLLLLARDPLGVDNHGKLLLKLEASLIQDQLAIHSNAKKGTAAPKVATPLWAVHYEPEKGKEEVQLGDWIPNEDEIDSYRHMNLNEHQDYKYLQTETN